MPTFEITSPDGKKYRVNAPEGATQEDALNHVRNNLSTAPAAQNTPAKPQSKVDTLFDNLKNSFAGGVVRGARDVVDSGAQMLTRGLESIAPAGSDFEKYMQQERQKVEGINNAAEQDYRQNWRQGQDVGIDGGRIAGNIAASLPLVAALPGASATTLPGRIGYGVTTGAASGALQPVDTSKNPDFAGQKFEQAAIGGAVGALSPFIADAIGKVVSGLSSKARSLINPAQVQDISQKVSAEFNSRGIDFNRLSDEMKKSLMDDVGNALKAGKNLDYEALARKADFESLGMKPTLGQVTRDPMQFQFEQNTRGIQGAGESLSQRFNEQNSQLIDTLNKTRAASGGSNLDKYNVSQNLIDRLKAIDATRKSNIDSLYSKARDTVGIHTPLNPGNFAQGVNDALDQSMLGDALPAGVRKALNQISTGEMPFTIQKAEQIRQAINGQMSAIPGRENMALKIVNDALQNEIDRVGSTAGKEAGEAFKAARSAAAERFGAIDKSAPLKAALADMAPEDFMQKFVFGNKARDILALRSDIQSDPQLWNDVRGQVVDFIKSKALNGSTDEFGKFSQSAYNKAIKQIGDAKMKILFNPDEIEQLQRIGRVAASIQSQPVGSAVNNSGTSQAVANLASRLSGMPYLRELAINPVKNFVLQGQVNSALNPGNPFTKAPASMSPEISRALLPFIAASSYPFVKPLLEK